MTKITSSRRDNGFSTVELLITIVVIALIGVVGSIVYMHHHKPSPTPSTTISLAQSTIKIQQLGVQITVPSSLSDLTYADLGNGTVNGQTATIVGLSTKALAAADAGCSTSSAPLGEIGKATGQYPTTSQSGSTGASLIKQYPSYYLYRVLNDTSAVCSQNKNVQTTQQTDLKAIANMNLATAIQPTQ